MFTRLRNMQFKTKIVTLSLIVLYANTLVMSIVFYIYASKDTIKNYTNSSDSLMRQMTIHLNDQFDDITRKVEALSNNLSFVLPMKNFLYNNANIDPVLAGQVANNITQLQMGNESIYSMYIYTEKGIFDNYIFTRNSQIDFKDTVMYQYFEDHPDKNIGWLSAMNSQVFIDDELVIPILYKQKIDRRNIIIAVNLSQQYLSNYLQNTYSFFENVFIVDEEGNDVVNYRPEYREIVSTMEQASLGDQVVSLQIPYQDKKYLVTYAPMGTSGYRVYGINAVENLTRNLTKIKSVILIELGIALIVSCVIMSYLAKAITQPLENLAKAMNDNADMKFDLPFVYDYNDEIGTLAKSYNHMIKKIDDLVKKLNEKIEELQQEKEMVNRVQAQKRQAELKVLQAQINPHFLYNTLNTITWQAEDIDANEISILSNALGKFFRISLSKGREVITIRDEIEHVKSYLTIQKIRYTTRLAYVIDVPKELEDYYMIKLILQPLVENAICHGIKEKNRVVTIHITGKMIDEEGHEQIELTVSDNGLGIEKEKLAQLNAHLQNGRMDSESGYGIYNVNERLRLYYGEGYGLRLESEWGIGTQAIVRLPVNRENKEIKNV